MIFEAKHYMNNCLLWLLLCTTYSAFAQFQNLQFETLSVKDGLSHTQIRCFLQDSRGFIWIGSPEDLNKYDGYNFTLFSHDPKDSTSISDGDIRGMAEDKTGNIWIATAGGGLNVFDRTKNTFSHYFNDPDNNKSLISNSLHSVFIDKEGNIITGSPRGISIFNPGTGEFEQQIFYNSRNELIQLSTILVDRQDNIWMATPLDGLLRFDQKSKSLTSFHTDTLRTRNANISSLFEDAEGYLWIGTLDEGLYRFDPRTKKSVHYMHEPGNPNSLCHNTIFSLCEDRRGNLWIGTQNNGVNILDKSRKNFTQHIRDDSDPKTLAHNTILSIFEDRNGTIWLGTLSGGINYYNESLNKFKHYKHSPSRHSVSNKVIKGFSEDPDGNIWISTEGGGLNMLDPESGQFTYYKHDEKNKNSLSSDYTLGVCADRKGNVWIGTYKGGLNMLIKDKGIFKVFKHNEKDSTSISSDIVNVVYEDHEGALWIGTRGGLDLFDPKSQKFIRYTNFPIPNRYNDMAVIYIYEDSTGKFWIGAISGLYLLDKKTKQFTTVAQPNLNQTRKELIFQVIHEDHQGNIWAGTDEGLYLVKKDFSLEKYPLIDGATDLYISGILEDGKGNLWISTHKGLACFDPTNKKTIQYSVSDGLQNEEFKRLAFVKTKKGEMYFGGVNGFNVFHPDSVRQDNFNPPVYITGFQIFNKSVVIGDNDSPLQTDISLTPELLLSYKHSVFSFEYAALNYLTPQKQKYAYMLEGFDNNWNEVGKERKTTYTNLDPGTYTFKVKSADHTGHWSDQVAAIKITITPPFWLTWWFKTLAAIFIAGSLITFYKIRLGNAKRQQVALEQLVNERTKQLALSTQEERQAKYESEQLAKANEELQATLETNKLQTQIIENKNAELDAFFYRISHDLKGPVASLLGLSILAKMEVKDRLALDYIQKQHQQVERLNHIITGLIKLTILDYSEFQKERIDFNKMVDDCILSFNGLANFENLTFKKHIQPGVEFYSQWALLNTIVQNLIENAIKYAKEQSPFAQIIVRRDNGSIIIQVEDNGQGIPIDHQSKIFQMFYRATLNHADGIGLGLYILKRSVDRLKGTIEVKSELGVGSVFTVKLPVH